MSRTGVPLQLNFLKKSALMLSSDSPSTSAHLLAVHNRILHEQSKPISINQQREFCPSCGTIRLPALTCTVSTKSRVQKRARRGPSPLRKLSDQESSVVYNCLRCHRQTIQPFKKQPRLSQPKKSSLTSSASDSLRAGSELDARASRVNEVDPTKMKGSSDNASSKKRAKARKQQGLLAALAASKQQPSQTSPPTSLDLLDFLQP
ncbi:hypothetical protein PRK78_002344 [Emydomyces testavorans]|uniref:Uncharacterized protein n=1 Tax=Emydomyces testavorans TaxID=2070801 RepID=A0AAF0DG66_9EURO|nr:hypothetical protein PRK78_002344 [Emydomyces testavorans]